MRGEGREVQNRHQYIRNFLSLPFFKDFTRQRITSIKINGIELKLKGRTINIK